MSLAIETWSILWAISLACEKKTKLKLAKKSKEKGIVVICDRYPQINVFGYNDGPLLRKYVKSTVFFMRWLSKWEYKQYNLSQEIAPDLVIRLIADYRTLICRRPEMTIDQLQQKQEGILLSKFASSSLIVRVEASQTIDEVSVNIMNNINRCFLNN